MPSNSSSIAFIDQYGLLGGGQKVLLELLVAACQLGRTVSLYCPDGPLAAEAAAIGVNVCSIPALNLKKGQKRLWNYLKICLYNIHMIWQTRYKLRCHNLIYVNGPRLYPAAILYSLLNPGARLALHVHLKHKKTELRCIAAALRRPNILGMAIPSEFLWKWMNKQFPPETARKLHFVENGLTADFSSLEFQDRLTRRPLRNIFICGRISPEKGQDCLIKLAPHFPNLRFHLLGSFWPEDENWYTQLRKKQPPNLIFHGWVDNLPDFVQKNDLQVCLVSSRVPEAFGLAAIEGMALSCLTLLRDSGGLKEIAATTGAWTFSTDEELYALLKKLEKSGSLELAKAAREQHIQTMQHYGGKAFRKRLAAWLESCLVRVGK